MAVADFDEAQNDSGARMALSGAMPGMVGAMMRRGGDLAALRDSITYDLGELRPREHTGVVSSASARTKLLHPSSKNLSIALSLLNRAASTHIR
jgi:hypothetical protein